MQEQATRIETPATGVAENDRANASKFPILGRL
jgi:hypothetical protein